MSEGRESRLQARLRTLSLVAGACVFVIGCLALVGWALGVEVLKSVIPGAISMKANTAVAFMLTGISLWLSRGRPARFRGSRWAAWTCATLVFTLGSLSLMEYALGWDLDIDRALFAEPAGAAQTSFPGRMAPATAFNFMLIGLSLLLLDSRTRRGRGPVGYLVAAGGIVAFTGLMGYLFGASGLYTIVAGANPMSLPAALAGVLAFTGLWLTLADRGLLALASGKGAGAAMTRRLLLPILLIPILLELSLYAGERSGLFDGHMVPAVHVVLQIAVFLVLLRIAADSVNRTDTGRLKAEEEARKQGEWMRVTLGSIGDGVLATGTDGRITFMNHIAESLTGWPAEEAVGLPFDKAFRLIDELERGAAEDIVAMALRERRIVTLANRTSLLARDGREIPVEDSAAPIVDAEGNVSGVVLVFHDVTERRRVEESLRRSESTLRESEAALRGVLDASKESIWVFAADGTVLMANSTAIGRMGRKAHEVIGANFSSLLSADLAESRKARLRQVVDSGQPLDFEDERDGRIFRHSYYPVSDAEGRVDRVASFSRDITGQKRVEEALLRARDELEERVAERTNELRAEVAERKKYEETARAERRRLFEVMETLPVYVILLDKDHRVPYANRFFRERFGDSGGKRCFEYLFGRESPCDICETYKVFDTNAPLEWQWTGPDGRHYAIYDFPFADTDGTPLILETGIDVTEERRLREGLERQTEQLRMLASELSLAEQRERRRLAQVLHDHLQQLLVGAKMHLSVMRRGKDAEMDGMVDDVDDLISQSIEASRTLTAELSPPILHDGGLVPALKWLGRWMNEKYGLDVDYAVSGDEPAVPEDVAALLFQSVKELLFNTVKHSKTLLARIDVATRGECIRIVVSDRGAGFDTSRLSLRGGQTGGFGLFSISERLVTMGGTMSIDAAPGQGTTVTLISPLSNAASRRDPAATK